MNCQDIVLNGEAAQKDLNTILTREASKLHKRSVFTSDRRELLHKQGFTWTGVKM